MIQAINLALIKIKKEYINKRIYLDCKKKKKSVFRHNGFNNKAKKSTQHVYLIL